MQRLRAAWRAVLYAARSVVAASSPQSRGRPHGVGAAIARGIAALHGGALTLGSSAHASGLMASVEWPLARG